jgi:ornithine cyclodeaminase
MPVRILSQEQVTSILDMKTCIDLVDQALRTLTRGGAILPLRTMLWLPEGRGIFGTMPSYLNPPDAIGLKAITVFPGNEGTRYDSHQGVVLLFEARHGTLTAICDASSITAIRTAAASGVATRALARSDAGDLAILGSGVQAETHLEAMAAVRPIRRVRIWSRNNANAERFAAAARRKHGFPIEVTADARAAVTGADLVCTVTSSATPIVEGSWIAPGTHLNAVGSSQRKARELDSDAVAAARLYVDRREATLAESGDFLVPKSEGRFGDEHIVGEVGEVLEGKAPGRGSASEITLFKSLGIAIEDLVSAEYVARRAAELGVGTVVEIGGLRHE